MKTITTMKIYSLIIGCLLLLACSAPSVPTDAVDAKSDVRIYPDYSGVTIPVNIAPLNFKIEEQGDDYVTHIHADGDEGFTVGGQTIEMDCDDWKALLSKAKGKKITIDTYVKSEGQWKKYNAFTIDVAEEEIDPYITYRLIEPSYVNAEVMSINQRCLENYDEEEIFNTCTFMGDEKEGQCINCHVAQNYNKTGNWQMHVRFSLGGTIIANGSEVKKVNLKTDSTISAGVYPAWHPTLPLIVYSNNATSQLFHQTNKNKIEVQDAASDIILYDMEKNKVHIIANDSTEWETFPNWSPDGKTLYYVSATVPPVGADSLKTYKTKYYRDIKYNIYKREFDAATLSFSAPETVYMASENNASATLPRVSPDGRYLLFTQGAYGTFHIWHHDADLYLMDLKDGAVRPLNEVNSNDTESYHNWSSNGRWILFSSRRDDGSFTRLYIAYFDKNGKARKPFLLPQRDPFENTARCQSYNIPEFIAEPVTVDRNVLIDRVKNDALQAE